MPSPDSGKVQKNPPELSVDKSLAECDQVQKNPLENAPTLGKAIAAAESCVPQDSEASSSSGAALVKFYYETHRKPTDSKIVGHFLVECHRSWAPVSYDRFLLLVKNG